MILFGMGCFYYCVGGLTFHFGPSVRELLVVRSSSLELGATTWSVQLLHHHQNLCDTGSAVRQYATFNTEGEVGGVVLHIAVGVGLEGSPVCLIYHQWNLATLVL
jgi:hypothetical protein